MCVCDTHTLMLQVERSVSVVRNQGGMTVSLLEGGEEEEEGGLTCHSTIDKTQITRNQEAGRAIRSILHQSSERCEEAL